MIFGNSFKATHGIAVFAFVLVCVTSARAQTPSPLQEWQYSSGIALQRLFEPNLPDWQVVMGAAIEHKPLYDGAELTRTIGGPVINVRYKDLWFASIGEGLGVNLWSGAHYRAGLAISYDLGRYVHDDVSHLTGLGDLKMAPAPKAFISYAGFEVVSPGDSRGRAADHRRRRRHRRGHRRLYAAAGELAALHHVRRSFLYLWRSSLHAKGIRRDDLAVDSLGIPGLRCALRNRMRWDSASARRSSSHRKFC